MLGWILRGFTEDLFVQYPADDSGWGLYLDRLGGNAYCSINGRPSSPSHPYVIDAPANGPSASRDHYDHGVEAKRHYWQNHSILCCQGA